jgi:tRNA pseudouridine38-40 synthase
LRLPFSFLIRMRIALGIEYDGTPFFGWQTQVATPTVQAELERALSAVAHKPISVHAGGRTDAGVHAAMQVAHFDTDAKRSLRAWVLGGNVNLHPGASILWAREVSEHFHARFSATSRRYRYIIENRLGRPALARDRATWIHHRLDVERMLQGAQALLGEHDFSAYRTVHCQSLSAVKTMLEITIERVGSAIHFEFEASGFLHHMVRNLVGSLLKVGGGEREPEWIGEVLATRDRTKAGMTAPAQGLTFLGPRYPAAFALPLAAGLGEAG